MLQIRPKSGGNSFQIIQTDFGTSPTADSQNDVLTLTSSDGTILITGDGTTDSIDLRVDIDGSSAQSAIMQMKRYMFMLSGC